MIGIDLDAANRSWAAEPDDRPVVSRPSATARLPSVSNMCRSAGKDEILAMAEEHVAAHYDPPAVLHRCQIDVTRADERGPIGGDLAVNTKARDSAIGKDVETNVSQRLVVLHLDQVARVALKRSPGDDLAPRRIASERFGRRTTFDAAAVE